MRLFLLFFSIVSLPLLAVTGEEPSPLVAGCVNAITGDLCLLEDDVVVQGYIPLRLPRRYSSGDRKGKFAGWIFLDHLTATYYSGETEHQIKIRNPNGSSHIFRCLAEDVHSHLHKKTHAPKFRPPSSPKTVAQAATNKDASLKNTCIRLEEEGKRFTVYYPDQTTRRYVVHHAHKHFKDTFHYEEAKKVTYLLESETLPSGHKIFYSYDQEDRVSQIKTTNPKGTKTYARATFRYLHRHPHNGPDVDIELSDGRVLQYRFESEHNNKIFFLQSLEETFYYYQQAEGCSNLINRIAKPNLRFLDVEYYRAGHNIVGDAEVKIKARSDSRCLRVKTLKAPVGTDATGHITHRFFYDINRRTTDVRQIDNTLIRYSYSPDMHLEAIAYFDYNDVLDHKETFQWSCTGNLRSKSLLDARGKLLSSQRFYYDDQGNVKKEELWGNLSGHSGSPEVYAIHRLYDTHNLLLKEEHQNGKTILYTYLPNTNLPLARLEYDGNQIKTRTFYEYNEDHVLTAQIEDDGTSPHQNDLSGVKARKLTVITPTTTRPFIDMPHIIEEKYWDGNQEHLLKKTVFSYTTEGRTESQEIYDAPGNLTGSHTLTTQFDLFNRPITQTDTRGQSISLTYDSSGNRIRSTTPEGHCIEKISYDYVNRPIKLEELGSDGIYHATHFTYDGKNRKISETDPLGNTTYYIYNGLDHLIETRFPQTLDENGKPFTPIIRSRYDAAGREISRTDPLGDTTYVDYNARSQVTQALYPDGTEELFYYNLDGSPKTHSKQ